MASSKYVLEFDAETHALMAKVDAMVLKFRELGGELRFIGDSKGMSKLAKEQAIFEKGMRNSVNTIAALKMRLKELTRAKEEYLKTGATRVRGGAGNLVSDLAGRQHGPGFTPIGGTGAGAKRSIDEIDRALQSVNKDLTLARSNFQSLNADQLNMAQGFAQGIPGYDKMLRSAHERENVEARTQRMLSQKPVEEAVTARQSALSTRMAELQDQKAAIQQSLQNQMPHKMQREVQDAARARTVEANALKQAETSMGKIRDIGAQIARTNAKAGEKFFKGVKAGDVEGVRAALDNAKGFGGKRVSDQTAKATAELDKYTKAIRTASEARAKAEHGESKAASYRQGAGGIPALNELDRAISKTKTLMKQAYGDDAAARMFPDVDKDMLALRKLQHQSEKTAAQMAKHQERLAKTGNDSTRTARATGALNARTAEYNGLIKQQSQLLGKMDNYIAKGQGAMPATQTPAQMKQAMMAQMKPLARTFTNVFSDMSRRFVMTLQFAISSAILFGTMRIVKEFMQTAIEVERAFKDIESAMEFDIPAPRGSAAFDLQVEKTRQSVLKLANAYNVLPTDANKSAYVMIARFKEIDNALMATRAQLLAVKVSTIDQSETLRALTAMAEGFAAAELDMNDAMTLNERLLKREATSAKLYMQALDLAVHIQQKYGVEVEDTLEGTARATEVFRQMGFTMNETAAIVAGTSRELGQTGQQAAERLVRSLGQLTDPKIRDALLDLAAGSSEFSLSISDFGSGAQAWRTITDQFQALEKSSPTVAREILQIVGQRRELEAVAAALGTSDLQKDIVGSAGEAAGAAETRFSYLSRTVSEMLLSIKSGFQELAQNFERLGGVTSLKLIVSGFDAMTAAVNNVLRAIIDLKEFFNGLWAPFGKGIGNWTVQFLALGLAITGVVRVTQSLAQAFAALTGTALFKKLAFSTSMVWGASTATAISAGTGAGLGSKFAGTAMSGMTGMARMSPAYLGAAAIAQGAAMKSFTLGLARAIPVWGWVIGGMALMYSSMKTFSRRTEELADSLREGNKIIGEGMQAARLKIAEEGLTGIDADLLLAKARYESTAEAGGVAASASPALQAYLGAFLTDIVNLTRAAKDPSAIAGGSETWQLAYQQYNPESVTGSSEARKKAAEAAEKEYLKVQRQAMREQVHSIDWTDYSVTDISPDDRRTIGLKRGAGSADISRLVTDLEDQAAEAQGAGDMELARELTRKAEEKYTQILSVFGILPKQLSDSVQNLQNEFDALDTDFQLGKKTKGKIAIDQRRISEGIRAIAEQGKDIFNDETYKELIRRANDMLVQSMATQLEDMNNRMAAGAKPGEGDAERIKREILIMRASGNLKLAGQAGIEARIQFRNLLREEAINDMALALAIAEQNVAEAVGWAETQRAKDALNEAQQAAADQAREFGDEAAASNIESGIAVDQNARRRTQFGVNKQIAVAAQRAKGPIMNSINSLKAQLVGISMDIAGGYLNPGELASALVQKNELIAQVAQAEQAEIRAYAESQISVRDAMKANQLELTMLSRELALTAKIFGRGSVEWSNVKKAMNNMQAALMDQALELEDIQRRLGSDITDPYIQASLDLVAALQSQKVPDMGDLEQARADLAVKEAQMADVAAFFDDRLFTLQFDLDQGTITESQYISGLKKLLGEVDTSTRQGKELWQEINGLIEGMTDDLSDMQFNIPGQIRLPTLFEVRRSLTADSLGVNYQDNRQQDIAIYVNSDVDIAKVANAVNEGLGAQATTASARYAPGSSTLTMGAV